MQSLASPAAAAPARLTRTLRSLKFRIAVGGVLALALGIGLTAAMLLQRAERDMLQASRQSELAEVVRSARLLDGRLRQSQQALVYTAHQMPGGPPTDLVALRAFIASKPVLRGTFNSVAVADATGQIVVLWDGERFRNPGPQIGERAYFKAAVAEGRPTVSELIVGGARAEPMVVLAYPVRHEGQVASVLIGTLEPAGLELVDAQALVSAAAVPGADWLVWRVRPLEGVLAPLRAARGEALFGALALMAAMGSLLLVMLWWLLGPLDRLRARAQHLFDGNQAPQAGWPTAGGEIGELTRVLRHVAAERAQLEAFNSQVIQRLQSVMATAPVGIAFTRGGHFELVSGEMCRLLGRHEHELLGQAGRVIYASNEEYELLGPRVAAAFAAGEPFDGELQFRRGTQGQFPGRLRGMPMDRAGTANGTIWTLTDITDEVAARQSLEWAATHDTLTGLANRKAFEPLVERLHAALPRSRPAALLLLDLDRFKPINDNHGHAAGDAMLRAVAGAIQACVRGGDLAVRLGGDEFAVLLERCPADIALRVAEDVRNAVAGQRVLWQGHALSVGASIGVAALSDEFASAADWVAAADRACYEAKAVGRNRVQVAAHLRLVAGAAPATA